MARNFEAELETLHAALQNPERWKAVLELRTIEEAWAKSLLHLGPGQSLAARVQERVLGGMDATTANQAAHHLAQAERWQREIGTWATASGEGLASMAEVHELKMARAWLGVALARVHPNDNAWTEEALRHALEIEGDLNGLGKRHAASIAALRAELQKSKA